MNKLKKFTDEILKEKLTKIEIANLFIWFHYVVNSEEITITKINDYFIQSNLSKYNPTYLKTDLRKSKKITIGVLNNTYKPQRKFLDEMLAKYQFVETKNEDIHTDDFIIPNALVETTRGYIENLSKQINASYNNNIFDGCAILMRRLLEILLIHSYDANDKLDEISENEGYKNLSYIIHYTLSTKPFKLSKEVLDTLDDFRQIGNFSAHKIQYNSKRKDIDNVKLKYRLTIEELLYTSKIKK